MPTKAPHQRYPGGAAVTWQALVTSVTIIQLANIKTYLDIFPLLIESELRS
jgi:hypothetical protein